MTRTHQPIAHSQRARSAAVLAATALVGLLGAIPAFAAKAPPAPPAAAPLATGAESAGIFSLAFRNLQAGVAVGGDYKRPQGREDTAAFTSDGGGRFSACIPPATPLS